MAPIQHNTLLNSLVIELSCSLLQFTGEVSPWSPASATSARETLDRAIRSQKSHVDRLVELLIERRWAVDFGVYPSEFTDLHFLSLKALLPRIVENQQTLIGELDEAVHTCIDDAPALEVLNAILAGERQLTADLQAIVIS